MGNFDSIVPFAGTIPLQLEKARFIEALWRAELGDTRWRKSSGGPKAPMGA